VIKPLVANATAAIDFICISGLLGMSLRDAFTERMPPTMRFPAAIHARRLLERFEVRQICRTASSGDRSDLRRLR